MDGVQKIGKSLSERRAKHARFLHSANHVLADELAQKLRDSKHFGYYLKMATIHDHQVLRGILGNVLEAKDVQNPGKLFTFLLKKHTEQQNERRTQT